MNELSTNCRAGDHNFCPSLDPEALSGCQCDCHETEALKDQNVETEKNHDLDLIAVLRSERYDDEDKRRTALNHSVAINIAWIAQGGNADDVVSMAQKYYDFLQGRI